MAVYTGTDGRIAVQAPSGDLTSPSAPSATNLVGQVTDWSLSVQKDILDVTALGKTYREHKGGLLSWTAEVTAIWDVADTSLNQDELEEMVVSDHGGTLATGDGVQINLYTDYTSGAGSRQVYYGAALVERADIVQRIGSTVTVRYSLRGNGKLGFTSTGS